MNDSLEAHAVSYAHELEAMVRQKNAEIEWLKEQLREGNARFDATVDAVVNERTARLQAQVEELTAILDSHRVTYPDRLGHWICRGT